MRRRGYLPKDAHQQQAEAFVMWLRRNPSATWTDGFERWSQSKGFQPGDRSAIREIAHEILFGEGHTTEPPASAA